MSNPIITKYGSLKNGFTLILLVFSIAILAAIVTTSGIFSDSGTGQFNYRSIRGENVSIYGKGIYQHMSEEVAIQGIAQDYVTLCIAIPLLLTALYFALKGSLKWLFILSGTLGYFFVTFLFYLTMAMYNQFYLAYVALLGASFFSFIISLLNFDLNQLASKFSEDTPVKLSGGFLIFNSIAIALLWLSIILPPLFDRTIYPKATEHYTTLIVQGLDLGILLPASFICGSLFIRKKPWGYLLAPVYFVFLSLLMTALTAKVIAMKFAAYNVVPAVFIIPTFNLVSVICAVIILRNTTTAKSP